MGSKGFYHSGVTVLFSVPFTMQPIRENIADFGDHGPNREEARRQAGAEWAKALLVIHDVFRSAVTSLADKKIITDSRKHDFYKSGNIQFLVAVKVISVNCNNHYDLRGLAKVASNYSKLDI